MATIALLGTMDTKGTEYAFLAEQIQKRGHHTLVIDTGILGEPRLKPDISRAEVASAGGADFAPLVAKRDRGEAVTSMSHGASVVLSADLQPISNDANAKPNNAITKYVLFIIA